MYEEFGDEARVAGAARSQADPSLIDSVRISFIGLLSKLSVAPAYEPLLEDSECPRDGSQPVVRDDSKSIFSGDSASVGTASGRRNVRHKSFYLNNSTTCACVLNLISTIMGSGVLGLPFAMSKTGWVLGILMLICCCGFSLLSLHLLATCAARSQPFTIQSVLKDTHRCYWMLVDTSQLFSCFGACLSYLVVIGGLMSTLIDGLGVKHSVWTHREIWVVVGFIVVSPPCFIETLDTLKYTSALSLLFICFLAFIMFIFSVGSDSFDPCENDNADGNCLGETHASSFTWETLRVISIFVFAFSGTQNILNLMNELTRPTPRRTNNVITIAYCVVFAVYCTVAFCGYATYGSEVSPNVLRSCPHTIGFGFARISTSLCVAFAFPVQFFPARNSFLALVDSIPVCKFKDGVADSTELNLRLTIVASFLLLLLFTIALLISDLGGILSFFGTCSIILGYIFPGASYCMMHKEAGKSLKWYLAMLLLVMGCILFPICLFGVIYEFIHRRGN